MEVIIHQAIGMKQEMKPGDHSRQHAEKPLSVLIVLEDVLPSIAPGGDVIEGPGKFNAEWSSHAGESSLPVIQETRSDPFLFAHGFKAMLGQTSARIDGWRIRDQKPFEGAITPF